MPTTRIKNRGSKAENFLDFLLKEGEKVSCDDSLSTFTDSDENLPPFYDEELFKKGQEFYHRNLYAVQSCQFFGLLAVLVVPSILKILMFTKMSSTDLTAFRRYVATIFHVNIWYDAEFKPGSKLWKSMTEVRRLHNSASKRSCAAGIHRINQKDMVLTQFGFIGFALTRSKMLGLYDATEEDLKALVHLWRVVGYVLGIEDRFNLCNGTVQETTDICNVMIEKIFRPNVEKRDKHFLEMTRYLTDGLWCVSPVLHYEVSLTTFHNLLRNNGTLENSFMPLTYAMKLRYYYLGVVGFTLRWKLFRIYHNFMKRVENYLARYFPFLAYCKFGVSKSHVKLFCDSNKTK